MNHASHFILESFPTIIFSTVGFTALGIAFGLSSVSWVNNFIMVWEMNGSFEGLGVFALMYSMVLV